MLKWIAKPLKEVNGIRFGMSRADVRKILGRQYNEFRKSKLSKNTTDDFGICHVFYDSDDMCEAVEVFADCEVSINGKTIFPLDIASVKCMITDLKESYGSYISESYSIGIYAPNNQPESILFGTHGYYL